MHALSITPAATEAQYAAAKALILEYRDLLRTEHPEGARDLDEELADYPGPYAHPRSILLLALQDGAPCGCLALRAYSETEGEVVRLYVQPRARSQGVAEALMRALIAQARTLGYRMLYLDSLHQFKSAHALYEKLGFTYCDPYAPHMTDAWREHMVFMRLPLTPEAK